MTRRAWVFAAVVASALAIGLFAALAQTQVLVWIAVAGLSAVAWPTLRRRSMVGLVLIYGFLSFGIIAAVLYKPTVTSFQGPNAAVASLALRTEGYHYLVVFLGTALAIWAGCIVVSLLMPQSSAHAVTFTELHLSPKALWLAVLPLLAEIYGTGFHTVFQATAYLAHTGPASALSVGRALGPIGVLTCGYFTFHKNQSLPIRALALLLALMYETMYLATATRSFALWVAFMFVGGLLTGTWSVSRRRLGMLVAVIGAIVALQVPLGLRNLPNHGLVPYVNYLAGQPSLVFGSQNPINNFLFGAPLTLYVAHNIEHLPMHYVVTSVSPLPSRFNDWSQIAPRLRLNTYTPYSALGELLNHGWIFFLAVMAFFGAGFALTERITLRRSGVVGGICRIIVFGAATLFVVESTEYNLRSAARLMYYAFVAVVVLTVALPRPNLKRQQSRKLVGDIA